MTPAQAIAANLAEAARDLQELNGRLSEAEHAFIAEANARRRRPPLETEIDADIVFGGKKIPVTLAVYGRHIKATKGGHEPGERPYEPDTPAGFDIHSVMIGETDILGDIGEDGEREIVRYVMENCE